MFLVRMVTDLEKSKLGHVYETLAALLQTENSSKVFFVNKFPSLDYFSNNFSPDLYPRKPNKAG